MSADFKVGEKTIGWDAPAFVIAEAGNNHDGDIEKARGLIRAAKKAGADAVKFQSFTAEGLISRLRPDDGGDWTEHPAWPVLKKLEVPEVWHERLKNWAEEEGLVFMSAPFEPSRAELLNSIGVDCFKTASGDLTNEPLLSQVASYGKPMIISTGASYLEEVERAVEVAAGNGCDDIALLHCVSLYPPEFADANLRCVATLAEELGRPSGLSDHTPGHTAPVASIALGAKVIEKHLTLDKTSEGPDHAYALEPDEFARMTREVRNAEAALGDGVKRPGEREMGERVGARRSVYAAVDIGRGTRIEPGMVKVVRHAYGVEPSELETVIGTVAPRDLKRDMPITREDLCR